MPLSRRESRCGREILVAATEEPGDSQKLRDVVMGDGHAFGNTGGARGVDQVSEMVGRRHRPRRGRAGVNGRGTDVNHRHAVHLEAVDECASGDHGDRPGVGEHETDPRLR